MPNQSVTNVANAIINKINSLIFSHNSNSNAHQDIRTEVDNKENTSNKTIQWSNSPDDSKYPSEKLVKNSLDNKASSTDLTNGLQNIGGYTIHTVYNVRDARPPVWMWRVPARCSCFWPYRTPRAKSRSSYPIRRCKHGLPRSTPKERRPF